MCGPDPLPATQKVGELKQGALVTIFETSSNGWHRIGDGRWGNWDEYSGSLMLRIGGLTAKVPNLLKS